MQRHALSALAPGLFAFLTAACGAATDSGGSAGGTAEFTVNSNVPAAGSSAGASYSLGVSFTTSQPACATTTVGACTVNPCYSSPSSGNGSRVVPNAGLVTLLGAESLGVEPQADGTYASESVVGRLPWQGGGDIVAFQWAHFPGDTGQPGDAITLAAPPYIALTAASAFSDAVSTVDRTTDLEISWTSDTPPTLLDQVAVNLISGSMQTYCIFNATAGSGVFPAGVLGYLGPGIARYSVNSKQHASESISERGREPWQLNFNVDAAARTSYGLAQGPVTIQ